LNLNPAAESEVVIGKASTSTGRLFSTMPMSANQTSPDWGSVGTEGLGPLRRLFVGGEQRFGLGADLEGQAPTDFDLGQEHVDGVGWSEAEFVEDSFGALQAPGRHARLEDGG